MLAQHVESIGQAWQFHVSALQLHEAGLLQGCQDQGMLLVGRMIQGGRSLTEPSMRAGDKGAPAEAPDRIWLALMADWNTTPKSTA